jgi:hypothetical protein
MSTQLSSMTHTHTHSGATVHVPVEQEADVIACRASPLLLRMPDPTYLSILNSICRSRHAKQQSSIAAAYVGAAAAMLLHISVY